MSLYRMPFGPQREDAPLFDYAAEAARKKRAVRRTWVAFGTVFALAFAVHLGDSELAATFRPWLPLVFVVAVATGILALAYRTLDRRH